MKTEKDYGNQPTTKLDSEIKHHLTKQLKLTTPAPDAVIHPIPQTRLPLLSDNVTFSHGNFTVHNKNNDVLDPNRPVPTIDKLLFMALRAIEAKAAQLDWIGEATSEIEQAGLGYVIRYQAGDIYDSAATGAHEVHGDIRAKYNAFGAANGPLGLPTTDETTTPDGIGRFNHFQGGSIYWTPNTGPMVVSGAIRNFWANQGWETNPAFGYPIADYFTKVGNPPEYWSGFQNGAIYSKNNITAQALIASIAPKDLTNQVRKTFDKALKAASDKLGIEGGVNILNISNWGYGFWESTKRTITYEIQGFVSEPIDELPQLPDPTFRIVLKFRFGLVWRKNTFTEPPATNCDFFRSKLHDLELQLAQIEKDITGKIKDEKNPPKPKNNPAWIAMNRKVERERQSLRECDASNTTGSLTFSDVEKTLVIYLTGYTIAASGIGHGTIHDKLVKKVPEKFPFAVKAIPAAAKLIDVLVTPQGGLDFLLKPNVDFPPEGTIRRDFFQTALNSFVESND